MDKKVWLSRRAVKLHVVILIVVPAFLLLCLWQVSRALDGNSLSWAYVFEWPIFAAYAIYMWWRFVHESADETAPAPAPATEDTTTPPGPAGEKPARDKPAGDKPTGDKPAGDKPTGDKPTGDKPTGDKEEKEDAELAAYNDYLAQLAERDKATGR
jgi:hypothetical protein